MFETPIARYGDLDGARVLITGGASGIGAEMVRAFHLQGAETWFIDANEAAGAALCRDLAVETRIGPCFLKTDITDARALADAVDKVAGRSGGLQVLVNNADDDTRHHTLSVTPEEWDGIVAVNLKHQYFASTAALSHMKAAEEGAIINFGSVAARIGLPDLAVYSACKSAVEGMTRSMAREFGRFGIRVNTILPGVDDERAERMQRSGCLDRPGFAEDTAQMTLFLASCVSGGCTGQIFTVDGGLGC